jgi:hypothetical protein
LRQSLEHEKRCEIEHVHGCLFTLSHVFIAHRERMGLSSQTRALRQIQRLIRAPFCPFSGARLIRVMQSSHSRVLIE